MTRSGVLQVLASSARRGAEIFAADLGEALETRGRSVKTVALAPGTTGGLLPVAVLGRARFGPGAMAQLYRAALAAEIIVAHGSRAVPACAAVSLGSRFRFVYRSIGDPRYWATTWARRARVTAYLRRAHIVVALWPGSADAITKVYGVPAGRIRVIPNGVPATRFPRTTPERRSSARAALGLSDASQVVLSLGALTREKNVGAAIRAIERVPDVCLVLAGDGPERRALGELAREIAPARVRFLGVVSEPATVLAAADVLILPSSTEGMPGALIEASFLEIPAIATDVGAVREMIVHGESGFVVAPDDVGELARGVRLALEAPAEFGQRAREHCLARYEIGVVADAWHDLLGSFARP